jgi:hypothetical protein
MNKAAMGGHGGLPEKSLPYEVCCSCSRPPEDSPFNPSVSMFSMLSDSFNLGNIPKDGGDGSNMLRFQIYASRGPQ